MKFLWIFSGFLGESLEDFFVRMFLEGSFWEEFFVSIGIDLFVNFLVFDKILSKVTRKSFRSLEVQLQVHRT